MSIEINDHSKGTFGFFVTGGSKSTPINGDESISQHDVIVLSPQKSAVSVISGRSRISSLRSNRTSNVNRRSLIRSLLESIGPIRTGRFHVGCFNLLCFIKMIPISYYRVGQGLRFHSLSQFN